MRWNEPITQSFSLSWLRSGPGSRSAKEENWRQGRLSKRAGGLCVWRLSTAHQTPTKIACVCVCMGGGHWGGRVQKTEADWQSGMQIKRCFWNDWEWNRSCKQTHGNCTSCVIKCMGETVRVYVGGGLCMCSCTARRSHEKFLLGAVVCFLSVKSYIGNIQDIFRLTPSWWWWTLEVTQYSGENSVYYAQDFMQSSSLFVGCEYGRLPSISCILLFIVETASCTHTHMDMINDKLDPQSINMSLYRCCPGNKHQRFCMSTIRTTVTVWGDLSWHVQHTNRTFASWHLIISNPLWMKIGLPSFGMYNQQATVPVLLTY